MRPAPPVPWLPKDRHGTPIVALLACHTGNPDEGERAVAPIKSFGKPIGDVLIRRKYVEMQSLLDATQPKGRRYYWKSEYLPRIEPTLATAATGIVRRIAPMALIEDVMTVEQIKDESVSPRRLNAALISSFGILAVIIAAVGIGGVLALSVSARTNEIGIRMSLGADSGRVQRMILREGGVLVARGLVLGVAGAYVASGVIRGLLFGVVPHDPVTFVGVAAMMAVIGIVACWIPALRAARIDPAITMRA